jgi:hypothetical protein
VPIIVMSSGSDRNSESTELKKKSKSELPFDKERPASRSALKFSRAASLARHAAICALLLLIVLSSCVTSIIPPASPQNPTTVCIVDYGRHASLVLPDNGTAVEFEYGEWKWFALGQTQSPRTIPVLFWPTQGTLGRRQLRYPPDPTRLKADRFAEYVLCIEVSSNAVARLRQDLKARYETNLATEVFNEGYDMAFVRDPVDYTALHNCNHELAAWLRELGCATRGRAIFARFKITPTHQ